MVDLKLQVPVTDKVEVDAGTLAAIGEGIKDAEEGRTVSIDEVRKMIPMECLCDLWPSRSEQP